MQIVFAAWIVWAVIKLDQRPLQLVLLWGFLGSFIFGYGWYVLLALAGGELIGVGNLLYLVAGLMVGGAIYVLEDNTRPSNDSP